MARRKKTTKKSPEKSPTPQVVGEVVMAPLRSVHPNDWNPNHMSKRKYESLVRGLREDGWLRSHALTVWGTDEEGFVRNTIIDGEHRHRAASAIGFIEGPMVFVNGITKAEAVKLTAKLDNTGDFDHDDLVALILEVRDDDDDELALEFGLTSKEFTDLMAPFDADETPPKTPKTPSQSKDVRTVKLAFKAKDHEEFKRLIQVCSEAEGTTTASDTILQVLAEYERKWC